MDSLDHILEAEYHLSLADMFFRGRNYVKQIESLKLTKQSIEFAISEAEKELHNNQKNKKGSG